MSYNIDEPIEVVAYNPEWPQLFQREAARLRGGLSEKVDWIEHTGSTSVPGMIGKPVVDLLFGVDDMEHAYRVAREVEALGYENLGEVLVPGRVYLRCRGAQHFNVVIVVRSGELWRRIISVRDYLRAHPEEVDDYCKVKATAVASGASTFLSYSTEKGPFLMELAKRAVDWTTAQAGSAQSSADSTTPT